MPVRSVPTNGVTLDVIDEGSGPPVVLCHGFPETKHSWRFQVPALAAAGYRVLAPDQRGYGSSSRPPAVADYGIEQLTGDLLGLLDDIGEDRAVFVGHDWGALIAWDLAQLHPERVRAVVGISVPFIKWPLAPLSFMRMAAGDNFMYIVYFQEVGPAEKELEADPRRTMARTLWSVSGDAIGETPMAGTMVSALPAEGTGFLTAMSDPPATLPPWLTESDLDEYAASFEKSGFFGPLSYYRNFDHNWELTKDLPADRVSMPSLFIAGDRDPVISANPGALDAMKALLPDLRGVELISGAGHWTQQEKADDVNRILLAFLQSL